VNEKRDVGFSALSVTERMETPFPYELVRMLDATTNIDRVRPTLEDDEPDCFIARIPPSLKQ
jgi:hypothetical protein